MPGIEKAQPFNPSYAIYIIKVLCCFLLACVPDINQQNAVTCLFYFFVGISASAAFNSYIENPWEV